MFIVVKSPYSKFRIAFIKALLFFCIDAKEPKTCLRAVAIGFGRAPSLKLWSISDR
jgi:hypothetical protein